MRLMNFCLLAGAAVCLIPPASRTHAADPWEELFEQPLVKWALAIGEARSLPWGDPNSWADRVPGYDIEKVPGDTQALLVPDAPVLARMETMRRAIVYSQQNPAVAYQMLAALVGRVREADAAGKADVLALFDLGYFFDACRQAKWLKSDYLGDLNGYALVVKAIRLAGSSAPGVLEMEFAAGLILLEPKGQHPYYPHFKTVVKEVKEGTPLERNLVTHLKDTFEAGTLAGMRASRYLVR
jgi:hypothetical protein